MYLAGKLPSSPPMLDDVADQEQTLLSKLLMSQKRDLRTPAAIAMMDTNCKTDRQEGDFVTDPARLDAATHSAAALAHSGENLSYWYFSAS